MKRLILILFALSVFATTAHAHNGVAQVMGTVTEISASKITVKTSTGKSQAVLLTATTRYFKGKVASSAEEIKTGRPHRHPRIEERY